MLSLRGHRKESLSNFPDAMSGSGLLSQKVVELTIKLGLMSGRPITSAHGRLFGGDTLFEVLHEIARERSATYAVPLSERLGRTVKQTRDELAKLESIGVLVEVGREGKARLLAPSPGKLAEAAFSLPELLVERLGPYKR
jgi:hypothetical protein